MNQNHMTIHLSEFTDEKKFLSGNQLGKAVFERLHRRVGSQPAVSIFGISLKGIEATDASFPRESVISLAKLMRGEKGFFLQDFASDDLLDNWKYAAKAKDQAVIVHTVGERYVVIGPDLHGGLSDLLAFVMKEEVITTSKVAKEFDISTPNASARMKKLHVMGLVLGTKESAETGGLEYVYRAIKWSD
jgi:hypothetical protein